MLDLPRRGKKGVGEGPVGLEPPSVAINRREKTLPSSFQKNNFFFKLFFFIEKFELLMLSSLYVYYKVYTN